MDCMQPEWNTRFADVMLNVLRKSVIAAAKTAERVYTCVNCISYQVQLS